MSEQKQTRKFYSFQDGVQPDAIVVHCSDPRFQEAFRLFVKEELKIEHPAPIVIPGSISSVGLELVMPKHAKALKDYVEFMVEHGKTARLVLINHEDCKMYEKWRSYFRLALLQQQVQDLLLAARFFKKFLPQWLTVEVYMAKIDATDPKNRKIYFEKLA